MTHSNNIEAKGNKTKIVNVLQKEDVQFSYVRKPLGALYKHLNIYPFI